MKVGLTHLKNRRQSRQGNRKRDVFRAVYTAYSIIEEQGRIPLALSQFISVETSEMLRLQPAGKELARLSVQETSCQKPLQTSTEETGGGRQMRR